MSIKKIVSLLSGVLFFCNIYCQELAITNQSITLSKNASIGLSGPMEQFTDLFGQSEFFGDKATLFDLDYQFISNRSKRVDKIGTILPPVGVSLEKRIISNLGFRVSLSSNWWVENNLLARSVDQDYFQEINYFYNTISLGPTWHIAINDRIDPYVGMAYSYRNMFVTCICIREVRHSHDLDLFMGMRYLLLGQLYGRVELGNTGVGYVKLGLGYRFGYK